METQKEKLGKVSITVEKDYWDIKKVYKKLTIVERQSTGTTYLSRKPVPAGTSISNRKYWIKFSKWSDIPYEITQEFGDSNELVISQRVITKKIDDLQDQINNLHPGVIGVGITANPNLIYDDSSSNVTITAKMNDNSIADKIEIKIGDTIIGSENNVSELVITQILNGTTTIKAYAVQSGFDYDASTKVTGTKPYYIGSGTEYNDIVNNSCKQSIKASPSGTYNVTINNNGDYVWFVVPNSMTINKVTMSGFNFPIESPQIVEIEGNTYKVYRSSNTYDAGIITIVIS